MFKKLLDIRINENPELKWHAFKKYEHTEKQDPKEFFEYEISNRHFMSSFFLNIYEEFKANNCYGLRATTKAPNTFFKAFLYSSEKGEYLFTFSPTRERRYLIREW